MKVQTADLCDDNLERDDIQVFPPEFKSYGGAKEVEGRVVTIKLDKSNWRLLEMLRDEKGEGKIVVVDVDKSFYGIVGDKLMAFAKKNDWAGIIINGYVRDTEETKKIDVALFAIGTCPRRNFEKTESSRGEQLSFDGLVINDGDYIYADVDGILVSKKPLYLKNFDPAKISA